MLFFKKKTIENTGFFTGFTDYHCHILPGVDDGVKTMEDSLAILKRYEGLGVKNVWFTPHIMEDNPNKTDDLRKRFEELKQAYAETKPSEGAEKLNLNLAAEYMMDGLYEERLEAKDILTLEEDDQVLVETSYYNPPMDLMGILKRTKSKGYFPILAHPERYMYMQERDYEELKKLGVCFQLNLGSLSNGYGSHVRKKAISMLKKGWYEYRGTDCHRMTMIDMIMKAKLPKVLRK